MKKYFLIGMIICFMLYSGYLFSAPMIVGPMTIKGTIQAINWFPDEFVEGVEGMSGSAGVDRIIPAHYVITLIDVTLSGDNLGIYEGDAEDGKIILTLNHEHDNLSLEEGIKIIITNYKASGDEGNVSTSYDKIEIVDSAGTYSVKSSQDNPFLKSINTLRGNFLTSWDWGVPSFVNYSGYDQFRIIPNYYDYYGQISGNSYYPSNGLSGFNLPIALGGLDFINNYSSTGFTSYYPLTNFWNAGPSFTYGGNSSLFIYNGFTSPINYSDYSIPLDLITSFKGY